jgi:hypothetical protein
VIRRFLLLALAATLPLACVKEVQRLQSPRIGGVDRQSPFIKAHMRDGGVFILTRWSIEPSGLFLVGDGTQLDAQRAETRHGWFTVPIAEVVLFETNVVRNSASIVGLSIVTGVSAALTVVCLTNTKSCFGSCPTFYAPEGQRMVLQAEGFSDSVAPSLERRDVDALFRTRPTGRDLELRLTNEALETHVIKEANLLAVPSPPGGRVFATGDGAFWQAPAVTPPVSCAAAEGDCLAAVRAVDGAERFSLADDHDLAARETIELRFPARSGPLGLAFGARQTLLSTYVLYQGLAFMGRTAGTWLAALETGQRPAIDRRQSVVQVMGGIEVLVPDAAGRWVVAGEVNETGPLAEDVHLVSLPPGARGDRVRLRMAKGHWRLDYVALASLGPRVEPLRLSPRVRQGTISREFAPDRKPAQGFPMVTLPGDAYSLVYRLPEHPERYELFLESRGYYLEWMRREWMADENPLRALEMVADPRAALRRLAPEFKRHEAGMEDAFWRSRYAGH